MFRLRRTLPVLPLAALALTACGTENDPAPDAAPASSPSSAAPSARSATESAGAEPRVAVTYDGGVLVLRAEDGEVLLDQPLEGYARLSPAGDERHAMVAAAGTFTALDLGAWTDEHGDHGHSFTAAPRLTDFTVPAEEPGHVVPHAGRTTLFDDGTGTVTAFDPHDLEDLEDDAPALDTWQLPEAHHGVAVQDGHGNLVHTVGDHDSRSGVRVATAAGAELAASDACPGVHGEAFAGDVAVFGCEDGVLVVDGREIRKVTSPDPYGRIGNQAGHESSPYVLGDYKTDPDAELERPTRVSLIDTRDATVRLVDLPASYTFRSLGRMPDGDGLVLGTDGALHVLDARRGRLVRSTPVIAAWQEPTEWQEPRPTLQVAGDTAYVTEPATRELHVVDLATMETTATHRLDVVPDELVAVTG
jgi:hypothetical protein